MSVQEFSVLGDHKLTQAAERLVTSKHVARKLQDIVQSHDLQRAVQIGDGTDEPG